MPRWKRLESIDIMERITRQQLCDNFDKILDKVDKEDIGFVILNPDGTDGQILCPAHWMDYCFDDDLGCILTCAIRYAISRLISKLQRLPSVLTGTWLCCEKFLKS